MNKRYLLLFVVYIFTVVFVFYCAKIYSNSMDNISEANNVVNDVTSSNYDALYSNIYNYSKENPSFKIYVAFDVDAFDSNVLYIDVNGLKHFSYLERIINDFGYDGSISKDDLPFYIEFNDGKIVNISGD